MPMRCCGSAETALYWQQVRALLWKNLLLKRASTRNALTTVFEVCIPLLVAYILVTIHNATPDVHVPASLHTDDTVALNSSAVQQYLASYPTLDSGNGSLNTHKIAFTSPDSASLSQLVAAFSSAFPLLNASVLLLPYSADAVDDYVRSSQYGQDSAHPNLVAAVSVLQFGVAANNYSWQYVLHLNSSDGGTVSTQQDGNSGASLFDSDAAVLFTEHGQTLLQQFMDSFITRSQLNASATTASSVSSSAVVSLPEVAAIPMPTAAFTYNMFSAMIGSYVGLMLIVSFNWNIVILIKLLVQEKELRFREQLRMMGVQDSALWLSWLATYVLLFGISAAAVSLILKTSLFPSASLLQIFCLFFLFEMSGFAFCTVIAAVASKAQTAAMMASLSFFAISFPFYAVDRSSASQQTLACLSAPICFCEAVTKLVNDVSGVDNPFTLQTALAMLLLDFALYSSVAWYLDQIVPTEYGTQRPWHFLFHGDYWRRCLQRDLPADGDAVNAELRERLSVQDSDAYEPPAEALATRQALRTHSLCKRYPRSGSKLGSDDDVVAVDGLTVEMYDGQIFGLLGVNGAGKTTTIHMLTGMVPATSGEAEVFGFSIHHRMQEIRRMIGVCPQHNVLYELLTVRQHLLLFVSIQGLDSAAAAAAVQEMIVDAELAPYIDTRVAALSGGQKRKTSLAIALLGASRVVVLDEPTAGMDPASRRSAWQLLERRKSGRLTILTTHSMQEAEQLADRIGIMAGGKLQCCGTSLFLKRRYGAGYSLDVIHGNDAQLQQRILHCIHSHVQDAEVVSKAAVELVVKLRLDRSPAFPALLQELETRGDELQIGSVNIAVTTLEEIFLKVAQMEMDADDAAKDGWSADDEKKTREADGDDADRREPLLPRETRPSPLRLFLLQLIALFLKRSTHARRTPRMWRLTILAPIVLTLIGMLLRFKSQTTYPVHALRTADYVPIFLPALNVSTAAPITAATWSSLGVERYVPLSLADIGINNTSAFSAQALINGTQQWLSSSAMSGTGAYYGAYAYSMAGGLPTALLVFFNSSRDFSMPAFLNLFNTAVYRQALGGAQGSIDARLQPFPSTLQQQSLVNAFTTPIYLSMALSMVSAFFAFYAVYERKLNIAHLQLISGLSPAAYYLGHFLFDYATFLMSATCCFLMLLMFGNDDLLAGESMAVTLLAICMYGMAIVPGSYAFSLLFTEPVLAQGVLTAVCTISSSTLVIVSLIMSLIPQVQTLNSHLQLLYRLLPPFCLGEVIMNLSSRTVILIWGSIQPVWAFRLVGWPLLYLLCDALVFAAILALVAQWPTIRGFSAKRWRRPQAQSAAAGADSINVPMTAGGLGEDVTVAEERDRLMRSGDGAVEGEQVTIRGLEHVYSAAGKHGPKKALQDVYFSVRDSECLGLLGVNGAGKTTLLKVLTSEIFPTGGSVYLAGLELATQASAIHQRIGYCFAESDTRVLTNRGLLFLDEIEALQAEREELLFGCYEEQSKRLLYSKGKLVFPPKPPPYLVDFTSVSEAALWAEGSKCGAEGVADDNASSCHVSLRVTPGHDMYVQLGNAGVSGTVAWSSRRGRCEPATGRRSQAALKPHRKVQAQDLLSDDVRACVRMLACAEAGYAPQATTERQTVQDELHLNDTQFAAFLELLGFWLRDGSVDCSPAVNDSAAGNVSFGQVKQTDLSWLRSRLKKAGLKEDEYWLTGISGVKTTLQIREPAWLAFFDKEFGEQSVHLPDWTLQELSAAEMRLLISGLHRGDGSFAGAVKEIRTSSARFRDQLVQAMLHCGYSAYAGLKHGDVWKVSWAELDAVHTTTAADSCMPSMSRQQCVTRVPYDAERDGRTWCVAVEHEDRLIIAQRARRGPDGRTVSQQSRPIVVGNCPQFDCLIEELTGRDHLTLFARIKGVSGPQLPQLVDALIGRLDLQKGIIDRPCKEYSGGNKRKLCVGIALVGEPSIVFLDEPSTGIDPYSRRRLWSLISSTMRGRAVILTSHMMEEVEALCQRIVILSHGRMQAMGSAQQLIARYGDGYEVDIQVRGLQALQAVKDAASRSLPAAVCLQQQDTGNLRYQVAAAAAFADGSRVTTGGLFAWLESIKREVAAVETIEYTVRQQTLEQVFLRLAAADKRDDEQPGA